jgi:protein-disulfide isomerase
LGQQSAKAAVADRQASPSDPVAALKTAAAVLATIANSGLPERGAHDAKVTIVFFDDLQCPYSAQMYKTLFDDVMKEYAERVKVVIRPLANSSIHPWAKRAAINASCLAAQSSQAYWDFVDYVHANQDKIGSDSDITLDRIARDISEERGLKGAALQVCLGAQSDEVVKESYVYVKSLHVTGVPTLFINAERIQSAVPAQKVRDVLRRLLEEGLEMSTHRSLTNPQDGSTKSVFGDQKNVKENRK